MSAKWLTILCPIPRWTLHTTHSLIHCERLCAPQMHRSISYHSVQCTSKFLVREKTRTRTYDRWTNFLYQDSRTSFLYKKLGPSAISLKRFRIFSVFYFCFISHVTTSAIKLKQNCRYIDIFAWYLLPFKHCWSQFRCPLTTNKVELSLLSCWAHI